MAVEPTVTGARGAWAAFEEWRAGDSPWSADELVIVLRGRLHAAPPPRHDIGEDETLEPSLGEQAFGHVLALIGQGRDAEAAAWVRALAAALGDAARADARTAKLLTAIAAEARAGPAGRA